MDIKTSFKGIELYVTQDGGKLSIAEISIDSANVSLKDYITAIRETFRATKELAEENNIKFDFPFIP